MLLVVPIERKFCLAIDFDLNADTYIFIYE